MSVAEVHGGTCGARFSMFAETASCDPMAPPLNTALAGTNFGSDPTPIEGRPSGLGHASVVTCRVCVRVCVAHADKNTRFVCTSGDPAAAYPRHVSSGLDTLRGRTPLPAGPEKLPSEGTNSPPHQVARVLGVPVRKSLSNYACMPLILPAPWPACPGVPLARLPCCPAQPGEDIRISQGRPPPPRCQRCRGHAQNAAWWRMGPFHTWFGRADPTSIRAQATHLTRCGGGGVWGHGSSCPLARVQAPCFGSVER